MKQEFTAVIRQHNSLNAAFVEPPFDVKEVFGAKRVKVKATFDGVPYRGSVVYMGDCYMLGMTQEIRAQIGKSFGDEVLVTLEKDTEVRTAEVPTDLQQAMENSPPALETFNKLPFTAQKEYAVWVGSAKREVTRNERIEKAVALLMEGKRLK